MPTPVSSMKILTPSAELRTRIAALPPAGVNLMAFRRNCTSA